MDGKKIGTINEINILNRQKNDERIQVMFSVKVEPTDESLAPFKWLLFNNFPDFDSAKNYLTENADVVLDSIGELYPIN